MKKILLCFICFFAIASAFAKTAEVDLINPDEPEADLGDASGDSSRLSVIYKQNPLPFVLSNIGYEFIPFTGGRGSFNQKDKAGGLMLWGAQFVTNGFGCVTAYYGILSGWDYLGMKGYTSLPVFSWIASQKNLTQEEYEAQYAVNKERLTIFGAVTLGCFVGETVLAIVRPICIAKKNSKVATSQIQDRAIQLSFAPVITPNSYGVLTVVHF